MKAELWMRENAEYLREQRGKRPPLPPPAPTAAPGRADPAACWPFREGGQDREGEGAGHLQGAQGGARSAAGSPALPLPSGMRAPGRAGGSARRPQTRVPGRPSDGHTFQLEGALSRTYAEGPTCLCDVAEPTVTLPLSCWWSQCRGRAHLVWSDGDVWSCSPVGEQSNLKPN